MEREQSDRAVLDCGAGVRAVCADDIEIEVANAEGKSADCLMPGSMELRGMRVLVVGLARTGAATALFCVGHNAIATATESQPESDLGEAPAKLREAGVKL